MSWHSNFGSACFTFFVTFHYMACNEPVHGPTIQRGTDPKLFYQLVVPMMATSGIKQYPASPALFGSVLVKIPEHHR